MSQFNPFKFFQMWLLNHDLIGIQLSINRKGTRNSVEPKHILLTSDEKIIKYEQLYRLSNIVE